MLQGIYRMRNGKQMFVEHSYKLSKTLGLPNNGKLCSFYCFLLGYLEKR